MKTMFHDTKKRVEEALEKSGYLPPHGIAAAKFQGWNDNDSEVHTITFFDDDGVMDHGSVYIDKNGKGEF